MVNLEVEVYESSRKQNKRGLKGSFRLCNDSQVMHVFSHDLSLH